LRQGGCQGSKGLHKISLTHLQLHPYTPSSLQLLLLLLLLLLRLTLLS
jgi:hypothetical protein